MQKFTTCLWFDGRAEEARDYYVSVFKNSKVLKTLRYGDVGPGPTGSVMTAAFELEGQEFVALNGGPLFKFTPAISIVVNCTTQAEVDDLWAKLSMGGAEMQCGWVTDKFGVSWQVIPRALIELVSDPDQQKAARVFKAMMPMKKLDIATLKKAAEQPSRANPGRDQWPLT